MKKTLLFLFVMLTGFLIAKSQVNLYNTDFESYTAGSHLAQQAGAPWTTWSNAPGGTEDPLISTTQAHLGTNSVNVVNGNDCVLQLYDKTTGRYQVSWWMYVESGKLGYFNFLSDFNGSSSLWALQVFMIHDSIIIDADGASKVKGLFASNTWKKMQVIVDLDDDFATFYVDGIEMVSYPWSKGAEGTDNSHKLDGIDFYGWDNNATGTSGYYLDGVSVDSVLAPTAPTNLTATLNGADIDVAWTAPSPNPDSYKLSRNGEIVYSTPAGLTYTDVAPWPLKYVYGVRAYYAGQGYSRSSNRDSVTIAGGVTRNLVLMEEATGTWCQYCPGAAMGLRDLIETNHKSATAIAYHSGDKYSNTNSDGRISFYPEITGFPTVIADGNRDGTSAVVGGNATVSMYPSYLPIYNKRIANPAFDNLDISIVNAGGINYTATITATETFTAFSPVKLRAALPQAL